MNLKRAALLTGIVAIVAKAMNDHKAKNAELREKYPDPLRWN